MITIISGLAMLIGGFVLLIFAALFGGAAILWVSDTLAKWFGR